MARHKPLREFITALLVIAAFTISAQSPSDDRPRFDVVSVKPNKSGDAGLRFDIQPNGRLVAVNMPLMQFIRAAYTLQLYQIADAPAWIESERFDITATTDRTLEGMVWTPGTFAPAQLMMQSVLLERFKMVAHMEPRETQTYVLVLRSDNSNKMRPGTGVCPPSCGMKIGKGSLSAQNIPLAQLAELLSQVTGRLVSDSTGLTGNYDVELRWAVESQPTATDAPSLFTAVQEQLGLRLESRRAPVPMLVIDSIERPSPD